MKREIRLNGRRTIYDPTVTYSPENTTEKVYPCPHNDPKYKICLACCFADMWGLWRQTLGLKIGGRRFV